MGINLDAFTSVRTSLFVRIDVNEYSSDGVSFSPQVLRFSDHNVNYDINGETYTPLGKLLGITSTNSEIRPTSNTVSITISGIPDSSLSDILYSKIKGSTVNIYRGFFDVNTNVIIGSITSRYIGIVNNYGLEEDFSLDERISSNVIQFECSSTVDVLSNKIAGRKTNPQSMRKYFPNDASMDRVLNIADTTFNFGAPKE